MENGPFVDGLPIKHGGSFHGYVSHNQMVSITHGLLKNPAIFWRASDQATIDYPRIFRSNWPEKKKQQMLGQSWKDEP